MDTFVQIFRHTPTWVWFVLAFLIWRGVKALQPADVAPAQLAIVPGVLTIWGLFELARLYGVDLASIVPWLLAFALGGGLGWLLLRGQSVTADRDRGVIHRPADYTVLPLVLIAFSARYVFGVLNAIAPDALMNPGVKLLDLGLSGALAGIFAGKFAGYLRRYLA
ncbi:DUF6622 family protein [Bosea sp. BH3]|uniref:DUF6622 family protein n=1 Tax=Bosea sp. BH3 TaxID=2871701 RepID=UPI0021CAF890|nr:DUF6622 family protein [Bosea sp. BH3]MCU4179908.1 hypothetical protein [Bosea sp. BH3]